MHFVRITYNKKSYTKCSIFLPKKKKTKQKRDHDYKYPILNFCENV